MRKEAQRWRLDRQPGDTPGRPVCRADRCDLRDGAGTARVLAQRGANVILASRDTDRAERAAAQIRSASSVAP
jgi:hypothetical protein